MNSWRGLCLGLSTFDASRPPACHQIHQRNRPRIRRVLQVRQHLQHLRASQPLLKHFADLLLLIHLPPYIHPTLQRDPLAVFLYQEIGGVGALAVVLLVGDAGFFQFPGDAALELNRLRAAMQDLRMETVSSSAFGGKGGS